MAWSYLGGYETPVGPDNEENRRVWLEWLKDSTFIQATLENETKRLNKRRAALRARQKAAGLRAQETPDAPVQVD